MWCRRIKLFLFVYSSSGDSGADLSDDVEMAVNVIADSGSVTYHGPHLKLSRDEELYSFNQEFKMVNEQKFICSLDLFMSLFKACCQTPGCQLVPNVTYHFVCTIVVINCLCSSSHTFRFLSSQEVNGIYTNNLQAASSIFLSGNSYGKVKRLADFYELAFLGRSTCHRYQWLYIIPEVNEWWGWMRQETLSEFKGKEIVVGGDGQCD